MSCRPGAGFKSVFLLTTVTALFAVTGCNATPAQSPKAPTLDVGISFQAKWWAEDQMEDLDLDDPPDKSAKIQLEIWEASDPVSTPHPQSFDVVATVGSSQGVENLTFSAMQRWGIGALSDGKPESWTPWQPVRSNAVVATNASRQKTATLTRVDVFEKQQSLYTNGQWPWIYAVRVEVTAEYGDQSLRAQNTRQLPILAGD